MPDTYEGRPFFLEPVDERSIQYRLDGKLVRDGDTIEVLTDTGWVSGHYRERVHPDTGDFALGMHLIRDDYLDSSQHDHVTVYIPFYARLRWTNSTPA